MSMSVRSTVEEQAPPSQAAAAEPGDDGGKDTATAVPARETFDSIMGRPADTVTGTGIVTLVDSIAMASDAGAEDVVRVNQPQPQP